MLKKMCVVELNTMNVKMVIANILENESFVVTDEVVENIKVAEDLIEDGIIKPAQIQTLLTILKSFKALCDSAGVTETLAVACNEYIDAKNQRSFLQEIDNQTGFRFRILAGEEQLNSIYVSAINSLEVPKGLIINISGNVTQIKYYNRRNLINQHIFNFGVYNLAESFALSELNPEQLCENMYQKFYEEVKKVTWLTEMDPETQIVGVGESFYSAGKLSRKLKRYPYEKEHNYVMSQEDYTKVYDFIKSLDIDKTKRLKGISSDRSDLLASGLCIIKAIMDFSNIANITVSKNSLCEGILFNSACPQTLEKPIADVLGYSLDRLNANYNIYSQNTSNVYALAMILFKQLKVLHKLSRTYVKVLRVASMLHDCGKRIDFHDYTKNGFEVVLNSDIWGVTHKEQILAAFVVASQNLDDFNVGEWVHFKDLMTDEDLEGVRRLAIIVRLADSLDKFNKQRVTDINCDILGDSVIMKTIVSTPAELEIREGMKVEGDFAKAYRKHLEIL